MRNQPVSRGQRNSIAGWPDLFGLPPVFELVRAGGAKLLACCFSAQSSREAQPARLRSASPCAPKNGRRAKGRALLGRRGCTESWRQRTTCLLQVAKRRAGRAAFEDGALFVPSPRARERTGGGRRRPVDEGRGARLMSISRKHGRRRRQSGDAEQAHTPAAANAGSSWPAAAAPTLWPPGSCVARARERALARLQHTGTKDVRPTSPPLSLFPLLSSARRARWAARPARPCATRIGLANDGPGRSQFAPTVLTSYTGCATRRPAAPSAASETSSGCAGQLAEFPNQRAPLDRAWQVLRCCPIDGVARQSGTTRA